MRKISLAIFILVSLFFISASVLAAGSSSLNLSPASGSYQIGQNFNVAIYANPLGETIDMVRANVSFPADLLEARGFTFSAAYNFPAGGNGLDNAAGTLSYGAGIAGGTSQAGTFGVISFRVKAAGQARVTINSNSLMLAVGENRFNGQQSAAVFALAASEQNTSEPTPQELKESPSAKTTGTVEPEENIAIIGEPKEGEVVALGEEGKTKESGLTAGTIIGIMILIILAIAGGLAHKFKNNNKN